MLFCLLFVLPVQPLVPALQDELNYWFLNDSSFSAPQWPIHPQPVSSHSSCFSNDTNVWTPQSAFEQEDDLANSRLKEVRKSMPYYQFAISAWTFDIYARKNVKN